MRIARVFPRRTNATPTDELAFVGDPGLYPPEDVDEVHVSVTFSWDMPEAERLVTAWSKIAPTRTGGPATGMPGGEFTPGLYVTPGMVVTSRGCPNRCWFCDVWRREGGIRELPIHEGYHVLDDNLLACSRDHVEKVFDMLALQSERARLNGGLEAKRLEPWIAERIRAIRAKSVFFAHDPGDKLEDLERAAGILADAGVKMNQHIARCYVLIGYKGDTIDAAEGRLFDVWSLGFLPMAMLFRGKDGAQDHRWRRFKTLWANPSKTRVIARALEKETKP